MPTATILSIVCVRSASGIDGGVFDAIAAALKPEILPTEIAAVISAAKEAPGVIEAIDAARDDPDNLYVTTGTVNNRDLAIWPGPGQSADMRPDQSAAPGFTIDFDYTQNLSLWEYDSVSGDDHLGSITMEAAQAGQGDISRLASSKIEGSAYYITYRVD